jgi:hypothetical protein
MPDQDAAGQASSNTATGRHALLSCPETRPRAALLLPLSPDGTKGTAAYFSAPSRLAARFCVSGPEKKKAPPSLTGPKVESRFKCGEAEFTEKRRVRHLSVRPPSPRGSQKEKSPPAGKRPGPDWGGRSPRRWWPRRRCHPMGAFSANSEARTDLSQLPSQRHAVWDVSARGI